MRVLFVVFVSAHTLESQSVQYDVWALGMSHYIRMNGYACSSGMMQVSNIVYTSYVPVFISFFTTLD